MKEPSRKIESIYTELLSKEWKGKAIWERIEDENFKNIEGEKLTAAPCLVGEQYGKANETKVMVVGRAVNGWLADFEDCSSLEATVTSVLTQKNRLDDFASSEGKEYKDKEGQTKIYYYAKSPFLRMMRQLVGAFTGTEENWQQRLVWSNLFKIAPRDGGNPAWLMIRNETPLYRELIKAEIRENRPDVVIFVTDMSFFDPYAAGGPYGSFREIVKEVDLNNVSSKYVCIAGSFAEDPDVKLIVCKRPEYRPIDEMVQEIVETYYKIDG